MTGETGDPTAGLSSAPRLTSLFADWTAHNESASSAGNVGTARNVGTAAHAPANPDSAGYVPADQQAAEGQALAAALLRACEALTDEMLRALPATPDDAAASLASSPFGDRVAGTYLPFEWLESFCSAVRLPLAELDEGWDISDGEAVYFCPRVLLADDADSPDDTRAYVRVDRISRWPEPRPVERGVALAPDTDGGL